MRVVHHAPQEAAPAAVSKHGQEYGCASLGLHELGELALQRHVVAHVELFDCGARQAGQHGNQIELPLGLVSRDLLRRQHIHLVLACWFLSRGALAKRSIDAGMAASFGSRVVRWSVLESHNEGLHRRLCQPVLDDELRLGRHPPFLVDNGIRSCRGDIAVRTELDCYK